MRAKTLKAMRLAAGVARLRGDDWLLASFPKAGNTWVRFFVCNLLNLVEGDGEEISHSRLDAIMPELGVNLLRDAWPYRTMPRLVKTHLPRQPLFGRVRTVYVVRDPRDIMVSYFQFERSKHRSSFSGSFSDFVHHPRFGLSAFMRHFSSWQDHWRLLLQYERLRDDPWREFGRLLDTLGVEQDEGLVREAIRRSSFGVIQRNERVLGRSNSQLHKEGERFARDGRVGKWREYFSETDETHYRTLKKTCGFRLYD